MGDDRIVTYLLNEQHERGKHKARIFKALGWTTESAGDFETIILDQVATVEGHYSNELGATIEEVTALLNQMDGEGLVNIGSAWFGDPASATTVISLTPAGRKKAERRQALSPESDEPVEVSREELAAELKRHFGYTDERLATEPALRGSRFQFWPSVGAWQVLPD